jgi:hypothetical protein
MPLVSFQTIPGKWEIIGEKTFFALLFVFVVKRKKDVGIVTFVIEVGQPEGGNIYFPCLLSAVTQGFSD